MTEPKYINNIFIIKSIKLWALIVFILTLFYIGYTFFFESCINIDPYDQNKLEYLRNITPAYPPPLVNFMDPPNVFNIN
jgi:hypothetical protein